jgi:hypothetical protein
MHRFSILVCVVLLLPFGLKGQLRDQRIYQLSGLVVSKGSNEPIPFVKIQINKSRRGTVCNQDGFYSIPVVDSDTLYFSSIGFQTSVFAVGEYLKAYKGDANSAYIYAIHYMREDSIVLPSVMIFPYNTAHELRTALIETKVPEMIESVNARDNLNPEVMDRVMSTLTVDEGERIMTARQLYYNQYLRKNVMPTMPLFDPIAAYQLLRHINQKAKERKQDNLDYWTD